MNTGWIGRRATPELNVAPLVDVILVLIVMLMVITPVLPKGFTAGLPEGRGGGPRNPALVLEVASDGSLFLNRQPVPDEELGERVAAALVGRPSRVLFLKVEDGVPYDDLVAVMDVCTSEGGVSTLAFIPR